MHVLVAEDDDRIAGMLVDGLERVGFTIDREGDGENAWRRGESGNFDAVVLDLGLPHMDGLTVLKRWRAAGCVVPVLVLTARGQWEERVDGIEAGADDYVVKPFHLREIVARLHAITRRAQGFASSRIEFCGYELDTRTMQVTDGGLPMNLTPQEFKLISLLVHNRDRAVSQREITRHLYQQDEPLESNAVEVLVARVRKRLGRNCVRNRRGFGYQIGDGL